MRRVLTSLLLVPVLWMAIKIAPPAVFAAVALVVIGIACWECLTLMAHGVGAPFKTLGLVATLAIAWSYVGLPPRFESELPIVAIVMLSFVAAMAARPDPAAMVRATLSTTFAALFVGLGLGSIVRLRAVPGEGGEDLVMLLFVCVVFADVAAFYVGRRFGRRRLAPTLSPKKSWEGAVAGLVASVLGAVLAQAWFFRRLPLDHALGLGLMLGVAAIGGDLAESAVKRASGVKDSSGLLPGHGGMLDRTDSVLFAGPILFYYYTWFLRGVV